MIRTTLATVAIGGLAIMQAGAAVAYVGPGAGLSAIGSVLAFFGVIVLMIVGFFWYPLKRMLSRDNDDEAKASDHKADSE